MKTEKRCTQCGEVKPLGQFSASRQGKYGPVLRSNCKTCASTRAMKWFVDNKERADVNRKDWHLRKSYGITLAEYRSMLAAQGGICLICGETEPTEHGRTGKMFQLSVDHCHSTGRIRGLLCQRCNRAIGLFRENASLLRKAADYLER